MGIFNRSSTKSVAYHIRVNILGNSGIGKSSLLMSYMKGHYVPIETPTIHEQYKLLVRYGNCHLALSINDSSGMPLNRSVRRYNYKNADVFIVCYAVDNPESFNDLPKWVREIRSTVGYVPIVLVALKDDLRNDVVIEEKLESEGENIVTFKRGKAMARKLKVHSYCECSSLYSAESVKNVFNEAIFIYFEGLNSRQREFILI
uniref:Cell division control protein 42 n=1 Tax=Ascaris suum TaxID=6253 RepID=F1LFN0_ASCSU